MKMAWKKISLFVCLLLVLAGCSAGSKAPPPNSPQRESSSFRSGDSSTGSDFAADAPTSTSSRPAGTASPGGGGFGGAPAQPSPPPPAPAQERSASKPSSTPSTSSA